MTTHRIPIDPELVATAIGLLPIEEEDARDLIRALLATLVDATVPEPAVLPFPGPPPPGMVEEARRRLAELHIEQADAALGLDELDPKAHYFTVELTADGITRFVRNLGDTRLLRHLWAATIDTLDEHERQPVPSDLLDAARALLDHVRTYWHTPATVELTDELDRLLAGRPRTIRVSWAETAVDDALAELRGWLDNTAGAADTMELRRQAVEVAVDALRAVTDYDDEARARRQPPAPRAAPDLLPLVAAPELAEAVETLRRLTFSDVDSDDRNRAFATGLRVVGQYRDALDGLPRCEHMDGAVTACRSLHPPLPPGR